jgi:hypothetical protein
MAFFSDTQRSAGSFIVMLCGMSLGGSAGFFSVCLRRLSQAFIPASAVERWQALLWGFMDLFPRIQKAE